MTKPYPTGAAHRADAAWKAKVVSRLKEKGWTRKDLAGAIGCDPSAITVVLRASTVQTRLMPAINAALDMDEPAKRHLLGLTEAIIGKPKSTPRG